MKPEMLARPGTLGQAISITKFPRVCAMCPRLASAFARSAEGNHVSFGQHRTVKLLEIPGNSMRCGALAMSLPRRCTSFEHVLVYL
jgi:hypothetical protein